jgi:hypothetical protein
MPVWPWEMPSLARGESHRGGEGVKEQWSKVEQKGANTLDVAWFVVV